MILKGSGWKHSLVALVTAIFCSYAFLPAQASETVTVFAAASLTNALTDIANKFADQGNDKPVTSFASTSTLAKQIENGAPANVFISADEAWMSYLSGKRLIIPETRFDLLRNTLVLVAPADSNLRIEITRGFPLGEMLGKERLATGDPDHVPAGKYAKAALEYLGVWKDVEGKLARADNVRSALALVERGECPLGIVYSTDAAISKKVKVVGTFPADSHPPIVYPAALVAGKDTPTSRKLFDFLKTPEARSIFEKYGFTVR